MAKFRKGQTVEWKWPPGYVTGVVQERYTETIRITTKGKLVTRHGTKENPAYRLLTRKGVDVLKLESELRLNEAPPGRAK
jgi:hypothetical protein